MHYGNISKQLHYYSHDGRPLSFAEVKSVGNGRCSPFQQSGASKVRLITLFEPYSCVVGRACPIGHCARLPEFWRHCGPLFGPGRAKLLRHRSRNLKNRHLYAKLA